MADYKQKHSKYNPEDLIFSVTKKDLIIETFRVGGNGGQKVNKTSSGIRITHPPSGAIAKSTESRSQHENRRIALKRLAEDPRFKAWVAQVSRGVKTDKEIEQGVKESLANSKNIKTEVKQGKQWIEVEEEDLNG